jgi:N-acetyl-alpha-D-muramate 1-phosphate uridylyltransferase
MKALIFAAGVGERMRPLTLHTPKPLLNVRGKPLIVHHLYALARAGVRDVVINLAHLGAQIRHALGDGAAFGVAIRYSEEGPVPLETGGGMRHALALLGSEAFIALNGDVFMDFDFASLPALAPGVLAHLVMVPNPAHHPLGDFVLQNQRLLTCGANKLTFSGVGVYRPELIAATAPGTYKLAPILREAMAFGQVSGQRFDGLWADIGTPERLAEINGADERPIPA